MVIAGRLELRRHLGGRYLRPRPDQQDHQRQSRHPGQCGRSHHRHGQALRALFTDNSDGKLFPSQFVNVKLLVDTLQNQIVIPVPAIQRGSDGNYVFVVSPDKTVSQRAVKLGVAGRRQGRHPGRPQGTAIRWWWMAPTLCLRDGAEVSIRRPQWPGSWRPSSVAVPARPPAVAIAAAGGNPRPARRPRGWRRWPRRAAPTSPNSAPAPRPHRAQIRQYACSRTATKFRRPRTAAKHMTALRARPPGESGPGGRRGFWRVVMTLVAARDGFALRL